MGCFDRLVKSHFLANVSAELSMARQTVKLMSHPYLAPMHFFNKKAKRVVYKDVLYYNYLLEDMVATMAGFEGTDMIFYYQLDDTIFIYSESKKQLNDAIKYTYNTNGDIPFHRARHKIDGRIVHTVLIDTRLKFEPVSPN
jgi:hypothetical protein